MDIGNESILETYLFETNSLLAQLDQLLLDAEQNGDFTEDDVNEIFRSMHTIKGSSAMLEFNSLMEISHHIEDLFFYIRENGMDSLNDDQKSALFNLMFDCTDKLREEIAKVENREELDEDFDDFIDKINNMLNSISNAEAATEEKTEAKGLSTGETPSDTSLPLDAPYVARIFFEPECGMENLRAFMLVTNLIAADVQFTFYPADVESNSDSSEYIIDHGFYIGLENEDAVKLVTPVLSEVGNIHTYEFIENIKEEPTKEKSEKQNTNEQPSDKDKEKDKDKSKKKKEEKKPTSLSSGASKQSLISVNLSKLDSLMAIVGEIVITESMVTSSPELQNIKLDSFLKSARQLRKLTDDLQDIAMSLRMVSISSVFQKMHRIVRDMSKALSKDVRLTIIGENTEVDKTIVDSIGDPIMHIVRNAMDHGIEENVEDRINAGKDPQGEIILMAEHTGSEVVISITDDGAGMDPEKILAKAEKNGLLSKSPDEYTDKEALQFLLMPGFSTNSEVTEFSGRGVGMDVVKKNIENIGGTVSLSSTIGEGSTVTLRIPLTLAIVDGMEIKIGDSIFTIPIANIRQSFKAKDEDIVLDASGNEMIKCIDGFYPIIRMANLYNIESTSQSIEDGILIWVEANEKSYCMFVDELIGEQQVVVKPLPTYLNNFNIKDVGISGCTILGDGNISLILDIENVYATSHGYMF